jgi:hypothetical protein
MPGCRVDGFCDKTKEYMERAVKAMQKSIRENRTGKIFLSVGSVLVTPDGMADEAYRGELNRDHKKENENPSIGVILCAGKEEDVVEYAMSRSLSPTMVAEYKLKLIDKALLEQKLREFKDLLMNGDEKGIGGNE